MPKFTVGLSTSTASGAKCRRNTSPLTSCLTCAPCVSWRSVCRTATPRWGVHTHFRHLPDEFDDYVANPKPNGYQSIHTVVLGPGGKTVEIQIRTKQMHEDAELGVAAHWKYKEGTSGGARSGHEDRIARLRKLIAWQEEMADSGEMLDEVRSRVFDDRVYVFTPKGTLSTCRLAPRRSILPTTSTATWGTAASGRRSADVSCRLPINCRWATRLKSLPRSSQTRAATGLTRTSVTSPPAAGAPKFTPGSASRIVTKHSCRSPDPDDELEHIGISLKEAEKFLLPRYNFNELDELLAAIGGGDIRLNQMVNFLQAQFNKPSAEEQDAAALKQLQQKTYARSSAAKTTAAWWSRVWAT